MVVWRRGRWSGGQGLRVFWRSLRLRICVFCLIFVRMLVILLLNCRVVGWRVESRMLRIWMFVLLNLLMLRVRLLIWCDGLFMSLWVVSGSVL